MILGPVTFYITSSEIAKLAAFFMRITLISLQCAY